MIHFAISTWSADGLASSGARLFVGKLTINCHFAEDILKCILSNGEVLISIKILLKFVLKGPIDDMPALI